MTELRQRYLQDLRLRNYSPKTLQTYVECVSLFARYFKRSPEELGPEHIREYQCYLVEEKKCSWSRFNQTVCALRFCIATPSVVTGRSHIPFPRKERKLPVVLSRDEAAQLLAATKSLKYRAVLSLCYGAGLRINEALHLQVADIDSKRMMIFQRPSSAVRVRRTLLPTLHWLAITSNKIVKPIQSPYNRPRFCPTGSLRGVRRRTTRSVTSMLGGGETTQRTLFVGPHSRIIA